ncbi:MAG: acyl-CoA dehydrogenase [Bacteriovoracaceae bacterium]
MGRYKTDLRDVNFNLFEVLKVENHTDLGAADLKDIVAQVDSFFEKEIFPTREKSDHQGVKLTAEGVKVPEILRAPHKAFYENGWFAIGLPEVWGGTPLPEAVSLVSTSLATAANTSWFMYPGLTRAALNVIMKKGTESQKTTLVPRMMDGRMGGTMCLTESGAGSDVGALRTTATPMGNGKYKINGTKIFISSGENDLYENIVHLVLARTPNAPAGSKGISLFVVTRYHMNADGSTASTNNVTCTKIEEKMGLHAQATCELAFGLNGECVGELIGDEFDGMATMFIMMNEARLFCGVQGEAQANLAYMMAEQYCKERVQFGTEIINHPDMKRSLLRQRAMSRGMRALCLYTANLFDVEKKDPEAHHLIGLLTPICKAYCSEQGFQVCVEALQAHGGYGFCTEYGIEQFVRDTKIATIYEGTNGIQAIDFVMRKILKDNGKALGIMTNEILKAISESPKDFCPKEVDLMSKVMMSAQTVMGMITKKAQAKDMEGILAHCTDFLQFASCLVMAWRLLDSAIVANSKLANASADDKQYYQSKIADFRIYCTHYLVHNVALAKTMVEHELNLKEFTL